MPNAPLFMLSRNADTEFAMNAIFRRLSAGYISVNKQIEVQGRFIPVRMLADKEVWFDFKALCGGPRSQADYLEIAHKYPAVFVSDIPKMSASEAAEAQRLVWLVDVLYDNRVKLVASSAVPPNDIFAAYSHNQEFSRTLSRLTEMQSQSYLELQHQTESVKLIK